MLGLRFPMMIGASVLVLCSHQLASRAYAQTASPPAPPSPKGLTLVGGDVIRGKYLVEDVAQCGRCHTPVAKTGERDRFRKLQGGPLDFSPTVAPLNWAMSAPRIAGKPPGTDEEFVRLMMTGISRTGAPLRRPMPQFHMTQADAEAVLAYLKSIGRVGTN